MARKIIPNPTLDQALAWLREHGFDAVADAGGPVANSFRVSKNGCVCVIAAGAAPRKFADRAPQVVYVMKPHLLLAGEPAVIVDRGYQKFVRNSKLEVAATAPRLKALHDFQEEMAQAIGQDQIYNEALGTVSDAYVYDRVKGRADMKPAIEPAVVTA